MSAVAVIDRQPAICDIADMAGGGPPLFDALMALKPDDLSPNAWMVKAGVNRQALGDIKKRGNATHETVTKLLLAIGKTTADLAPGLRPVLSEVRAVPLETIELDVDPFAPPPGKMPLLGSAVGGAYEDIDEQVEVTELYLSEVRDWVDRGAALASDPRAYALTILGSSMVPAFHPNSIVKVSTRAAPAIGDYVIVQLRQKEGGDTGVHYVLIKRLARLTGGYVELEQFNPAYTFRVPIARIALGPQFRPLIHKVVSAHF